MHHSNPQQRTFERRKHSNKHQKTKFQSQSGIFNSVNQRPRWFSYYKNQEDNKLRDTFSTMATNRHITTRKPKATDFIKLKVLGKGRYGNVCLVCHKVTGFIAAMKIIEKQMLKDDSKLIQQLIQQIKLQSYMINSNIIELFTFFSDDKNIYLLMELASHGQLFDFIQKKGKLYQQSVGFIAKQLLNGLNYIHSQQIIHRDLKPQNIVLIHGVPKICDFGWSVYCPLKLRSTFCGTPLYLSPQILIGESYTEKIDTWALGALIYQLFAGQNPFKIRKREDLQKIITDHFEMNTGSKQLRDFVQSTLCKDPKRRPDSKKLSQHPFIKKYQELQTAQQLCF